MAKSKLSGIKRYIFSGINPKLAALFLGIVFIVAAIPKIVDLQGFYIAVDNYQILPEILVPYFAVILISVELVVGLFLIVGVYKKEAAFITVLLNIVFIIALTSALIRGIDITCGCFSLNGEAVSINQIIRDIFLILLANTILFCKDNDELKK